MAPGKRRFLLVVLALTAAAGVWLFENASVPRLRARFVPQMKRLEALRDGLDSLKRAIRLRTADAPGLSGAAPLVGWAWRDLARADWVEVDVLGAKDLVASVEARATFRVGGVAVDGSRLEREGVVPVRVEIGPGNAGAGIAVVEDGWVLRAGERRESRPRFRNATAEAGLGAPRNDPDQPRLVNHLIEGIWPGSGVAVLDIEGDGKLDLFVGDGRSS